MIKLMAFISRLPHLDPEAFKTYYETKHAPMIAGLLPGVKGYERNYLQAGKARPGKTEEAPVDFDAVTILRFDDREGLEAFKQAMRDPEVSRRISEDEANFLDSSKSRMFVVDERLSEIGGA